MSNMIHKDQPHTSSSSLIGFTGKKCEQKWREKLNKVKKYRYPMHIPYLNLLLELK